MAKAATPPASNTGASITDAAPSENRCLIDFLSWTVKTASPHDAISLSGLDAFDWSLAGGGGMGYKSSLRCGQMVVFFDGRDDMGCHVSLSGQGCRQYESQSPYTSPWGSLLQTLFDIGANITRLDLAIDNVDGQLDLSLIMASVESCEMRTRFKCVDQYRRFSTSRESMADNNGHALPLGETIYFGSKTSRLLVRFYNKAAQLKLDTKWIRCELQCREERAIEAAKHLLNGIEVGELAFSALNQYLAFINLDDSNISRCSLKKWWENWLLTTKKIRLTTAKAQRYIHEVVSYLERQYSATFAMLRKYYGVIDFRDVVAKLVDIGKDKMTKKHEQIITMSRVYSADLPF